MRATLASVWAVIVMGGIMQAANALQTDLLGVRGGIAGFSALSIGVIMAGYYVGYSAGPLLSPAIIGRVGRVPTIALGLLIAATIIVLHGVFVSAVVWTLLRAVSGLTLSMVYVAGESWINDRAPNRVRGRIFSIYMVLQMIGMTGAQFLLAGGNPGNLGLFVVSAVLFAVSVVPIVVAAGSAPGKAPPLPFGLVHLLRISPLGTIATVFAGVSWSIIFTFGPVFAEREHFNLGQVGFFMGVAMAVGAVLQFPLGWISDAVGRRLTIGAMCAGAAAASLFGIWAVDHGVWALDLASALAGGLAFPLYALSVAHTNNSVPPELRVAATSGLVLLFGLGSIVGPLATGWAMTAGGPAAFFEVLAAVMAACVTAASLSR